MGRGPAARGRGSHGGIGRRGNLAASRPPAAAAAAGLQQVPLHRAHWQREPCPTPSVTRNIDSRATAQIQLEFLQFRAAATVTVADPARPPRRFAGGGCGRGPGQCQKPGTATDSAGRHGRPLMMTHDPWQ